MHTLLLQSSFPLLLITSFLSINVELSLSQDDQYYANCSEAINCGGIGGISYPFWGVNRADYCGLPGFEVKCVDNAPMINMSNIKYRILKTDSSSSSVTVARQDYWETICPQTYVSTSINFSLFNYTSGLTNLTFYYGCNISIKTAIPGVSSLSQACNGDINVSYVTRSPQVDPVTINQICASVVIVPVLTTAAQALEANRTTIKEVLDGGFELGLQIDNVQCNSCENSGGKCGLNTTTGGFSCFCLDQAYASVCKATAPGAQGMSAPCHSLINYRLGRC
ncbi:LEAF RUST 10 DISEASE-RESISTANCE LOCUS RECEPTOR-LIKE PROTEIN KINASE-like 2.5 [Prunus yedoensis var. nudiflora]|uniref:non-specific serine/threonine protein kinase n=1 Tax=Prunus yedoensis var. nudiflora TaxID=2094558 RepID=A0A314UTI3_PRUYE|nr:LEAF RUST 10 DISEASE-RESISTANCE LOCUS RECEPTOR-LIKE PROTEIN KINASE-like 2.5 [Prunus yedoensis var. nudiflora]